MKTYQVFFKQYFVRKQRYMNRNKKIILSCWKLRKRGSENRCDILLIEIFHFIFWNLSLSMKWERKRAEVSMRVPCEFTFSFSIPFSIYNLTYTYDCGFKNGIKLFILLYIFLSIFFRKHTFEYVCNLFANNFYRSA